MKRTRSGFSLLEYVVAVGVLALLTSGHAALSSLTAEGTRRAREELQLACLAREVAHWTQSADASLLQAEEPVEQVWICGKLAEARATVFSELSCARQSHSQSSDLMHFDWLATLVSENRSPSGVWFSRTWRIALDRSPGPDCVFESTLLRLDALTPSPSDEAKP